MGSDQEAFADDPEANFYPDNTPLDGVELWDVVEKNKVRYEVWLYASDCGSVFLAGKSKRIGAVIQFGLECDDSKVFKTLLTALEQTPDKSSSLQLLFRGSAS